MFSKNHVIKYTVRILGLMLMVVCSSACTEEQCKDVIFFYDKGEHSQIQQRLNSKEITEYVRTIHGAQPASADQVFFVKIATPNSICAERYDMIDELWIVPSLNEKIVSPICEEIIGEPEKLLCGAYLTTQLTLSIVFRKSAKHEDSDYADISKEIVEDIRSNVLCN